jgi:hypothetical protein
VRNHDRNATSPKLSREKDQTQKRTPEWYAQVRREALEALERCRKRDELWRKRRAEAKALHSIQQAKNPRKGAQFLQIVAKAGIEEAKS